MRGDPQGPWPDAVADSDLRHGGLEQTRSSVTSELMVPDGYRDFFIAMITLTGPLTGPLIGLVFVAVSVNPRGVGRSGPLIMRIRAASSLSAFVDALFLSLVALLPNGSIGTAALVLGLSGAVATVTFVVLMMRERREIPPWQLGRMVVLSVGSLPLTSSRRSTGSVLWLAARTTGKSQLRPT